MPDDEQVEPEDAGAEHEVPDDLTELHELLEVAALLRSQEQG